MRRTLVLLMTLSVFVCFSCTTTSKEITAKAQSIKDSIFTEVRDAGPPPGGFTDVTVRARVKTHMEGQHAFKWVEDVHGKQGYPFLLNIDGQAVTWRVKGQPDITPLPHGETERPPEAGPGMKYVLQKRIRLAAGPHLVFFALPGEDYFTQVELSLKEQREYTLEFEPVYGKSGRGIFPSFLYGISSYEVFLNGNRIQ